MSSRPSLDLGRRIRSLPWRRVLTGVMTVAVFGYLAATLAANWQALLEYEWRINPIYLAAGLFCYLLTLFLGATAWHRVVWSMDARVPYRTGFKFYLQSNMGKRLPGLIWYALGRVYLYKNEGVSAATISVALTLELVTMIAGGVLAYLLTVWGAASAIPTLSQWWLILPAAVLLAVILWPGTLYRVVNWVLVRRHQPPLAGQAGRGELIQWSLLHLAAWLAGGVFTFFLAAGVNPDVTWADLVPVVNSWAGSGLVAVLALIVPVGLGVKEVTLAYLLSSIVPWPVAVVISLFGRICGIIGDCIGLVVARFL